MRLHATDELALAHAALMDDLRELETTVRQAAPDAVAVVRAELGRAKAHVTKHFMSEERDGYMADVRKRDPRFDHAIEALRHEHRELASELDGLIRETSSAVSLNTTLRERVTRWVAAVRDHERSENRLVQEAFGMDISAED